MTRRNLFQVLTGAVGALLFPRTAASAPLPVVTAPEALLPTYTNILSEEACAPPLTVERMEAALQEWKAAYPYRQMGLVIPMRDVSPYTDLFERGVRKVWLNDE